MPAITNASFDPNTPPRFGDDIAQEVSADETPDVLSADAVAAGNRLAMADAAQRDMHAVVGTTQIGAAQRDMRLSDDRAQAERGRAESVAARGGEGISTALRGDVGKAVSDLLRLNDIVRQASAIEHRINAETEELEAAKTKAAEDALLDDLLAGGWTASEGKRAVPAILAPFMQHAEHQRPIGRPEGFAVDVRARLRQQHAERAAQRVREDLEVLDGILLEYAEGVLSRAASTADTLQAAGLSVDATADDVIDAEDTAVSAAWRGWRAAVQSWTDLQSARRWVFVAAASGFREDRPLELVSDNEAERVSWSGQFEGGVLSPFVEGSHSALAWWLENGRPQAVGVAYARETVEA
nr:hypothetical protein [Rhodococcus sp. (in: high G+C Gram-positive bacteria)]